MLINVTLKKLILDRQQQAWIKRRLEFALGRFASRIRRVSAVCTDVNGARGGVDKECRLQISLIPHGNVIVTDLDSSFEAAASNVAARGASAVARLLSRLRETGSQKARGTEARGHRILSTVCPT